MSTMTDIFGPPIHSYTRSEAIADGVLIEATPSVVGRFPVPVAYTAAAHADSIAWDDETDSRKQVYTGQDRTAREADVFWMFTWLPARTGAGIGSSSRCIGCRPRDVA